jgi:hypothetical protein
MKAPDVTPPSSTMRVEDTIGAFLQRDDTPRQSLSIIRRDPVAVPRTIGATPPAPEPPLTGRPDRAVEFDAPADRAPSTSRDETEPRASSAIERLIERTVQPVPLPDLRFRLVPQPSREADEQQPAVSGVAADRNDAPAPVPRSEAHDDREDGAAHLAEPHRADKPYRKPAAPPQIDVGAVADKVFRMLQRRQRFERERTGRF